MDGHAHCGHGYVPLKCGGGGGGGGNWNTTTKTECKNEVDQPWNWNLPCSVWCMSNKIFTHDYSFLYLLSVIMCERAGQNNC